MMREVNDIVYKVVCIDEAGRLFSCMTQHSCELEYLKNEFVRSKFGQILCFDYLSSAMEWCEKVTDVRKGVQIWKATAKGGIQKVTEIANSFCEPTYLKYFWQYRDTYKEKWSILKAPEDTVGCYALRLDELVLNYKLLNL
jgi:hypothetical protein